MTSSDERDEPDAVRLGNRPGTTGNQKTAFKFEWMDRVIDTMDAAGIAILGTPTYAIPPWMSKHFIWRHPLRRMSV